jgi:flagellar basal-body rod modification protein FlgD
MNNNMKKQLLTLTFLAASTVAVQAQNVHFNFTDGTQQSYALQDVRKTTFTDDVMNLHLTDGTVYSWNVSTIGHYEFDELVTVGNEPHAPTLALMKVYPNPTTGSLSVEYALEAETSVTIELRDMQGRTVRQMELGTQPAGQHTAQWDGTDTQGRPAAAGTYLCRIITPRVQMSRTFIIQ